jgi:large subunit ribosomal protein L18
MIKKTSRKETRAVIQKRIRAKIQGTAAKPRLCVFKSLNNIYAQAINDENGTTICEASTLSKEITAKGSNVAAATEVGKLVAKRLLEKGINTVVFDRNGYIYHGKVKAVAEAAREAGLQF